MVPVRSKQYSQQKYKQLHTPESPHMDPFGYNAAQAAPQAGYNNAPPGDAVQDGYSPDRVELKTLLERLRARYGRRKGFRLADVQKIIAQIREEARVERRLDFGLQPTPMIDLTDCDVVIE